ncbi:methyl-accepting chemotaxis protein [Paracidovorax wautersii]|uniref:Methyl-accepting chemotaxis protein n=1 Tax=Paracidovorax wautersii TaxID=1177982 RepID=A0ABU1IA35_9BURK|nr:methyl-accepting chemotaxis protein [Paracidovorax wautersii]MDR6214065.1 methyl-accepting chemotaxis protein [Paracidovorax wautersii]
MKFLREMQLGAKLGLGFTVVILIGCLVALYGRVQLEEVADNVTQLADERLETLLALQDLRDQVNLNARVVRNMAMLSDPARIQEQKKRIDEARTRAMAIQADLRKRITSDAGKALVAQLEAATATYRPAFDRAVELAAAEQMDEARNYIQGPLRTEQERYFNAIDQLVATERDLARAMAKASRVDAVQAGSAMLVLAALAAALGAVVAWTITRQIKNQLGGEPGYATEIAQQVARGHLAMRIALRPGDTTSLLAAMERMRESLSSLVSQVRQSSESIATGASQIATGNADLSQRTEEQASNLQQTAASMEEIGSTIQQNTETVRTATQMAGSASQTAARGGSVVNDVVATMQGITDSSRKIGDIIGVIDGIAFQTNILALNAAVEAARAGEQGRGFAVVASEVRSLAQRSAEAAKEIKLLIGASVERVEAGSQLVNEAGTTMGEIVQQARRVADLIEEIGAATHEQEQGISQVGDAVNQLDQVTQQNAALVEESAAAADSLNAQAARLVQLVSVFVLDESDAQAHLARAVPAAAADARREPVLAPASAAPAIAGKKAAGSAAAPAARPAPARRAEKPAAAAAAPKPAALPQPAPRAAAPAASDDWESF